MKVRSCEVFTFLNAHRAVDVRRVEIASIAFGRLRYAIRQMVQQLKESCTPEGDELSEGLRNLLSEWLTVPVCFDSGIKELLADFLGRSGMFQIRWGHELGDLYVQALDSAAAMALEGSSLRAELSGILSELRSSRNQFRVICSSRARIHYESLLAPAQGGPLTEDCFLFSAANYRQASPFDTLIKVGPLRTRGWGAVPDAIRTAPRFSSLIQLVWQGCHDEQGFGYDPVSIARAHVGASGGLHPQQSLATPISGWNITTRHVGIVGGFTLLMMFEDGDPSFSNCSAQ